MKLLLSGVLIVALLSMPGCGSSNNATGPDPEVLDNNYSGTLHLNFSNTFPEFDESTSVSVEVDKYGNMTFGTGTLDYSGEDDNGEIKIKRTGTLTIQPNGEYISETGNEHLAVNENTTVNEHMQTWVWDGSEWQPYMDENITATWNGGLVFDLDEAATIGSVCEITNSQGSIVWTLTLTPGLAP